MEKYKTISKEGSGEVVEKKSRFLSFLMNVESEEAAEEFLSRFRKKYYDARHVCFAYILKGSPAVMRASDDGEPSGTAGKPLLELLMREGLSDCLIVVVRYFGGVLLGTGGLLRAYTEAGKAAAAAAECMEKIPAVMNFVKLDYTSAGRMPSILAELDLAAADIVYSDVCEYTVPVPADKKNIFEKKITELTNGRILPEEGSKCYYAVCGGEVKIFEV